MFRVLQLLIRLGTSLIPVRTLRRRVRRHLADRIRAAWLARMVPLVRARYREQERCCREKLARGESLRVCFLVCDVAMFSAEPVFQAMLKDARFDPFIAVAPRVSRGEAFLRETQNTTLKVLSARYGSRVEPLYNPDTKQKVGLEGRADVIFTSIVYSDQTFPDYTAETLSGFALLACVTYGYSGLFMANVRRTIFLPEISLMWRYFVSNPQTLALWAERNPLLKDILRLSGYVKMDRLALMPKREGRSKTVVIAPHHSLPKAGVNDGLSISTFLTYADLFLRLPVEYPDLKFVFRPHPLLFPRLATREWWGAKKTADYRAAMEALANVEFQQGGDYFATFANSDALIHDCGSFLAEYYYTGRPQCYLLADHETESREFLPFGRMLLDHTYKAYSEADIRAFLDQVVKAGNDPMKQARDVLSASEICCGYPHAAECAVNEIVKSIRGE
ncbi:MAG: hypothetical protein MJ249_05735 [Kiritimatiellae bacterium]|nr:hypothetical protein [Kiritimatiellia bacterium]